MKGSSNSPTSIFPCRQVLWPCSNLSLIPMLTVCAPSRLYRNVQIQHIPVQGWGWLVGPRNRWLSSMVWIWVLPPQPLVRSCAGCCCLCHLPLVHGSEKQEWWVRESWPAPAHASPAAHQWVMGGCRTPPLPLPREVLPLLK